MKPERSAAGPALAPAVSVMRLNQAQPSWVTSAQRCSSASSSLGAPGHSLSPPLITPLLFIPLSCSAPQTHDPRSGVTVGFLPGEGRMLLPQAESPGSGPAAACHPTH